MTKFTVDMSYTVTYCHTVEIDAASEQEAKKKARDVFDAADIEKYWGR